MAGYKNVHNVDYSQVDAMSTASLILFIAKDSPDPLTGILPCTTEWAIFVDRLMHRSAASSLLAMYFNVTWHAGPHQANAGLAQSH